MKFNFKSYFKNVNEDGQGTACLDFQMEVLDSVFRDEVLNKIMKILSEEPREVKTSALGFTMEEPES